MAGVDSVLVLNLIICCCLLCVTAQESGFFSLDCGGQPRPTSVGIDWVSDESFIDHLGSSGTLPDQSGLDPPLSTVRYFPGNRSKYCYAIEGLSTDTGSYLVRASFLYGMYNGTSLSQPMSFQLIVGADVWTNVSIDPTEQLELVTYEIYLPLNDSNLTVCLAKTGVDIPFISTLELRPLGKNLNSVAIQNGSFLLHREYRVDYGAQSTTSTRYPEDRYDRIWDANTDQPSISTFQQVDTNLVDQPPQSVMSTAFGNGSDTQIWFSFNLSARNVFGTHRCYIALYFCEIGSVSKAGERVFNIYVNGDLFYSESLDIYNDSESQAQHGRSVEVYSIRPVEVTSVFNVTLWEVTGSVYGPLMSAIEVLRIADEPMASGTDKRDADALVSIKSSLGLNDWAGDPCMPYAYNWLNCSSGSPPRITALLLSNQNLVGSIPPSINTLTGLIQISLSANGLTGQIPDLSALTNLQTLDLKNNNLSGPIPDSFSKLPKLSTLFLQNNNLSGPIPQELQERAASHTLNFNYSDNPFLCENSNSTCSMEELRKNTSKILYVGLAVGFVALAIVAASTTIYYRRWKKNTKPYAKKEKHSADKHSREDVGESFAPGQNGAIYFTYEEIQVATENFTRKIGEGGFGSVFHGILANGQAVAVKVLSGNSCQGMQEFRNEVDLLSRVHHKKIVSLIGYCNELELILVYEYMPKGTLREHLYGTSHAPLTWRTRLIIALDAAQGLEYLHEGCSPNIIHRDVKSSNILLSETMGAKVADFGLSKSKLSDAQTHVSTVVMGTAGYLDPEYFIFSQLTAKSDVYSFGVVLLEIICGRPPIDTSLSEEHWSILSRAQIFLQQGNIEAIVDPALGYNYNLDSMRKVAEIAMMSVESCRHNRPTMGEIISALKEAIQLEFGYAHVTPDLTTPPHSLLSLQTPQDISAASSFSHLSAR